MSPQRVLIAVVGLILLLAPPAAADSLLSALTDTYQLNQQIAAERAAVRGKDELAPEAKSNLWRPHVFFQPQTSITRTPGTLKETIQVPKAPGLQFTQNNDNLATDRLLQISATMNIFDSGMSASQLRQAKALIEAERGILKQTEQQVFQAAATQYGQIVLNDLLVQYALEVKQETEKLRPVVRALQEQHFLTMTAVTQIEEQYQSSVLSYEQAKGAARAARAQFLAVVGRPPGKIEGWPKLEPSPGALEAGIRAAFLDNPQIQTARSELAAAQASVDVAKTQLLPVLSVFGGLSRDWNNAHFIANSAASVPGGLPPHYQDNNTSAASVGLRMTLPLYQGGAEYANVRAQINAVLQNQRTVIGTEQNVRGAVEAGWENLVSGQAQYKAATAQVTASRQSLDGMKRQFQDGTETITDVLTEVRNWSGALASAAQAGYSYYISVVAYQVAVGRFNAKDMKLPVALYDPLDHYEAVKSRWFGFSD